MRLLLTVAAIALALLGGALLWRLRSGGSGLAARPQARPERPELRPIDDPILLPEPATGSIPSRPPNDPLGEDRVASLTERLFPLLRQIKSKVDGHKALRIPYSEEELAELMAWEREATGLAAELSESWRRDPREADVLLAKMLSIDDDEVALRLMDLFEGPLDTGFEARLAEILRTRPDAGARRIGVAGLARQETPGSLSVLLAAAEADADAAVRIDALDALALRGRRRASADEARMIVEALDRRAAVDPDDRVRARAADLALAREREARADR